MKERARGIQDGGFRTGGMKNRRDAEHERCWTGGIGKVVCKTGENEMQDRSDTGKEGFRK